jgi:L-ascorbate metabolism protein UlaG (beta-lactamase superfamily)
MQITKYLHSCLLIEEKNKTILLDPGVYSTPVLDINTITKIDAIGITHEHPDHLDIRFMKKLVEKFPDVQIFSNNSIKIILAKENIVVDTVGNTFIKLVEFPHEKIWMGSICENSMITVFDILSHPGDSLSFTHTANILALPITAPWGSTTWAVAVAEKIKPKVIIPIHDFMWKDEIRIGMYSRLQEYFAEKGIDFKEPLVGKTITLEN